MENAININKTTMFIKLLTNVPVRHSTVDASAPLEDVCGLHAQGEALGT